MDSNVKKNRTFKVPHLLNIIFVLIILASILTYIVPAGTYEQNADGTFDPSSYHQIEQTPVSLWQTMVYIVPGMQEASQTICLILFTGGCMGYIIATESITKIINYCVYRLQDKGITIMIPCIMFMMSLLSAFGGNDSFVAFVAVGVIFAKKLRLDPIVAFATFFLSQYVGFATGPNKIVLTAQMIADVPVYSGFGMRFAFLLLLTAITTLYTMRYAIRVSRDPSKSLMGSDAWLREIEEEENSLPRGGKIREVQLDMVAVISTLSMILSFVVAAYGATNWGWNSNYTVPCLFVNCIFTMIINRTSIDKFARHFARGVTDISLVCFIIGLARVISYVMERGQILHTLVHWSTIPLGQVGKGAAVVIMFLMNLVIDFFIPSGQGQAAIVMPLMTPIADMLGISRQVICSAFSLGDGLSNLVVPTLGILMGGLEMAKCPYNKWMKFMMPLLFIWIVVTSVWLVYVTSIGWMY